MLFAGWIIFGAVQWWQSYQLGKLRAEIDALKKEPRP
jgi:hypothetical protein